MSYMGLEKTNKVTPDNKKKFNFLTTEELREKRFLAQKVRNIVALGIFGTANAVLIAFIIAYFNLSYLQGSDAFGLGLSPDLAETIFSYSIAAGSIGFLGTVIIGGAFSDDYRSKYGARAPYILAGCLLAGVMLLLTPIFAGTADADLMIIIFPMCFFLIYVGLGLASSPSGALLSELFTKEQRGWVGLILAGFTVFGSLIGLVFFNFFTTLLLNFGQIFQLQFLAEFSLFLFPALIIIISGVLVFFLVEKANPPYPPIDSPITDILQTPRYLLNFSGSDFGKLFFVQSFWGFASEAVALYLIIHLVAAGLPEDGAPFALLVTGVVSAVMVIPAGLFIQKYGKVKTAIVGSLIYSGFCFLLAGIEIGNYYPILIIIIAIGGFGAVFIEAVRASLPADLVPEGKEAQFMGINRFGSLWTQPFVAILGGFLLTALIDWEYSFTAIMFGLAGLASLIATVLLFLISYEKMVRDEYEKFYKRYLAARGFFEEKITNILDSIV
ncbi:MAG: MFS transporter [Candidatus Heimdallarchaeota archaeon]|nr:MAG: MFS transporter [Candidatus Heimdallarchaeota archaeon]